ncbi:hypothetical protein BD410DRAFT_780101 [Rickenella mellea]|uniref:HIG1 domain-containing protein n=1 Tax=Rickenella mellea TaxID=50990 RepID=A0A4R5XEZ9_9AGAM|nr:hypothetical protein BD410DRAFT_780101 [Rickenella mellea]
MKLPTPEQEQGHRNATVAGAAKGLFGGLAVALPASFIAHKRWPYYRALPPSLKALGVVTVVVPSFAIAAERAGLAYERSQWHDIGQEELDTVRGREQAKWDTMSSGQKFADFAARHQFSVIGLSWAASVLGAYTWISRDPYQTTLQKIASTRVWAQGLTLGVIIAGAALTHSHRRKAEADHTWLDIIEQEEREKAARK